MALRVVLSSLLLAFSSITATLAQASVRHDINIPSQQLGSALAVLAKQTHIQLVYSTRLVEGYRAEALSGSMTPEEALTRLLKPTGLKFEFLDTQTITLVSASGTAEVPAAPPSGTRASGEGEPSGADASSQAFWARFLQAQADQGTPANAGSVAGQISDTQESSKNPVELQEVVVTAQKRNERLLDVPVPVTAISADMLVDTNQLRLQDYYTSVPGLSVTPDDARGAPILTIRGLTTGGYSNPTVGITIDDVPYGSSTNLGGGFAAPDIDPSDLARVEVLRGPQGTLYGASSIGGLLKFVTVDPSTDGVSGHLQTGTNSVYNGDKLGYSGRGTVNVPLSDTFAIRASGFTREDPGYIDNVLTDQEGINRVDANGGRLSALWRPTPEFSLKFSALYQDAKSYGSPDVDMMPGLGDLQQSDVRGTGGYDRKVQVYSVIFGAKLGLFDLTALTGYSINSLSDSFDATAVFGPFTQKQFGVTGTPFLDDNRTTKLSQELRLSTSVSQRVDWMFGLFYTHESTKYVQQLLAADPLSGSAIGSWVTFDFPTAYTEYAAFTDVTLHFTDRFDVQIGGRESRIRQSYSEVDTGPYVPLFEGFPSPLLFPMVDTTENAFTYLATPRLRLSPDLMVYARLASGYRPGGPNSEATPFGLPATYKRDTTENYEVGVKGNTSDRKLSFDASLYYIDWKDIQLSLVDPTNLLSYFANATRAKSQGIELSAESRPFAGLTMASWVAWNEAVLTAGFPTASTLAGGAYGVAGNRLPDGSRFSGSVSFDQEFPVTTNWTGSVGVALSYVGDRLGAFTPTPQRQDLPGYARTDVHARFAYETWTAVLFVNNVADRRGILTGGLGTFPNPAAFNYIQPRTFGLLVSKAF